MGKNGKKNTIKIFWRNFIKDRREKGKYEKLSTKTKKPFPILFYKNHMIVKKNPFFKVLFFYPFILRRCVKEEGLILFYPHPLRNGSKKNILR